MAGVNKVIIVGNLGGDPETRQFDNGGSVTNISVATSEKWKDKNTGEMREETEWHRISFFGRLAEIAAQYLRKGSKVYIEGSLKTRKYQAQDGSDRYVTEIKALSMQMLDSKGDNQSQGNYQNSYQQPNNQQPNSQPPQNQFSNQQAQNYAQQAAARAPQPSYQNQGNFNAQPQGQAPQNPADDDIPF